MILTPLALLLIVASGLSFSGLDLLRKLLTRRVRPAPLLAMMALGQSPLFLLWWWFGEAARAPGAGYIPLALTSVVLNIVANLAMLESVRIAPLSMTIPLLSLAPAFTSLLAIPLLDQVPSSRQWVGIGLVVVGAFLLAPSRRPADFLNAKHADPGEGTQQVNGRRQLHIGRGSLLMAGTAFLWSLTLPVDRLALDLSGSGFHGLVLSAGVGGGTVLWLMVRGRAGELRRVDGQQGLVMAAIVAGGLALALQLMAMTMAAVGLVDTVKRAVNNFMAVVVGRIAFGEPVTWRKSAAVAVMALGVALVLI